MKKCYAVVFMNYYPLEVDSLWETREEAEAHIGTLTLVIGIFARWKFSTIKVVTRISTRS